MEHLNGRVVVVTGASGGIGRELALGLAARGARLVLAARRVDATEATAEACRSLGAEALALPTDVTRRAGCEALIRAAEARFGAVDVLVNNAGRADQGLPSALTDDDIDAMMDLNLKAPLHLIQAALPGMRERGRGHILNVVTHAAFHGFALTPGYVLAKCALHGLTLNLAYELADTGIHVTGVYPGLVDTGFNQAMAPTGAELSDLMSYLRQFRAGQRASEEFKRIERPQKPSEVAAVIIDALERPGRLLVFPQEVHQDSVARMVREPAWWMAEAGAFYRTFLPPLRDMMARFMALARAGRGG